MIRLNKTLLTRFIGKLQAKMFTNYILKKAWTVPMKKQEEYLNGLQKTKDDIDRMILKNKCQLHYVPFLRFGLNIISAIYLPFIIIYLYSKRFLKKKCKINTQYDIVFFDCVNFDEVVPENLLNAKMTRLINPPINNMYLNSSDLKVSLFLFIIRGISPYLYMRYILKRAAYRFIIDVYQPKIIAITNETSPTAVGLTAFCRENNIRHINFMHGEKIFTINEAFNHFDQFYVFDEFYKKNFLRLCCEETEFIIHQPKKFKLKLEDFDKNNISKSDFVYYLEEFTEEEIRGIKDLTDNLMIKGFSVKLRPHPRFNNPRLLKKYFDDYLLEDTSKISFEESLSSCNRIISTLSAILYQGTVLGIPIYYDDINYKDLFSKLQDKNIIIFSKEHHYISELFDI